MTDGCRKRVFLLEAILLAVGGSGASLRAQSAAPASYVQIVAVTVQPQTIHKQLRPRTATIKVVLRCTGSIPQGAKAEIAVHSAAGQPPENDAVFDPPITTVPLKRGKIVCKVKIQGGPKTVTGSIMACADILEHGGGRTISGFPIVFPQPGSPWLDFTVNTLAP